MLPRLVQFKPVSTCHSFLEQGFNRHVALPWQATVGGISHDVIGAPPPDRGACSRTRLRQEAEAEHAPGRPSTNPGRDFSGSGESAEVKI